MNICPDCGQPVQVWSDLSDGVTCNFACDNPACLAGKGLWDTPRPKLCSECGHNLMDPSPEGEPGDDSYYCEGCGAGWTLDLSRRTL